MKIKMVMVLPYEGYHVYFMYGAEWFLLITKQQNNSLLSDLRKLIETRLCLVYGR